MDAKKLKSVPLFEGLSQSELEAVAKLTDEIDVGAGAKMTKQEGFAHEFAIIEAGTADVLQNGEKINELGPGDFFGEIGLLSEGGRRTATVVATSPMSLIVMFGRDFRHMEHTLPEVAAKVRAAMQERLARA